MPAICNLLTGNLALHTLDLTANDIDNSNNALISLAEAVGKSALRRLSLSSNPISLASLAAFIDSVPANGTALERLDLSSLSLPVHDDDETTQHQAALAANAIADLITDPQRCRSLVSLTLDGNNFGSRGVRTIASALVGNKICDDEAASGSSSVPLAEVQRDPFFQTVFLAKLRRPNTSLLYLGLSGNVERGWLSMDPNKEIERLVNIKRRYASIPLQDIEAIVSFFHHRTRRQRLQAKETIDNEAPIEVTRHLASLDVTMDEWQADFKEAFEVGSGLNSTNWQIVLLRQLDRNRDDGKECRSAALAVLAAARTLGCRARRQSGSWITEASGSSTASTSAGFPRFLDLPPELRLHILRQLDENASLSARQFNHVISFACEPSTIGYGSDEYSWSRVLDKRVDSVDDEGSSSDATLPARRWSWIECFALRAPPRDWVADLLDSDRSSYGEDYRGVSFLGAPLNAFLESTQTHRAEPK
ncbi:conserved hypothetical Ustilaginaceae-specific protein [Sporisorium reilianum SRZ2]|uniref:Conserved hypothetical Ustilaginaceae-specific protein n=1 Tax=Sporisorium reilianum (strain SRZ2) TaxID=999809 RepID=E6ZT18_SPORE|nr:conserved hypothetical Ustilaginaceae-specific protein [Sporisorium reilianum SRZ2]